MHECCHQSACVVVVVVWWWGVGFRLLTSESVQSITAVGYRLFGFKANMDAIELDVWLTADGQVAVFHDGNLLRMCGVENK